MGKRQEAHLGNEPSQVYPHGPVTGGCSPSSVPLSPKALKSPPLLAEDAESGKKCLLSVAKDLNYYFPQGV